MSEQPLLSIHKQILLSLKPKHFIFMADFYWCCNHFNYSRSGQLGFVNLLGITEPHPIWLLIFYLIKQSLLWHLHTLSQVNYAHGVVVIIIRPIMEISQSHLSYSGCDSCVVLLSEGHRLPWSIFTVRQPSHISVLCVPLDLREIVFVVQSQRNSFHVRQAEERRADLLKQVHGLTEVRFESLLQLDWHRKRHI